MPRTALFPGSFDPVTNGHLDVVRQAVRLADRLLLAIGTHPGKTPLFSVEERIAMLEETCAPVARAAGCELQCITFGDLVVATAKREGASLLIRGLRSGVDFEYEMEMAGMNATMAPDVQTVCSGPPASSPITATLVRQIASMGGDVSAFVPPPVAAAPESKVRRQSQSLIFSFKPR
jgi:pantetheine-phosphate adenylyltransferase